VLNRLGSDIAGERYGSGRYRGDLRAREGEMSAADARFYGQYLADLESRYGEMDAADYQRFGELAGMDRQELNRFLANERIARGRFVGEVNSGVASRVGSNYESMGNAAAEGAMGVGNAYGRGVGDITNLAQEGIQTRGWTTKGGPGIGKTGGGGYTLNPELAGMTIEDLMTSIGEGSMTIGDLYGMFEGAGGGGPPRIDKTGSGSGTGSTQDTIDRTKAALDRARGGGGGVQFKGGGGAGSKTPVGPPNLGPGGSRIGVAGSQAPGYDPISGVTYSVPPGWKLDRRGDGTPYLLNMNTFETKPVETTSQNAVGGYPGIALEQHNWGSAAGSASSNAAITPPPPDPRTLADLPTAKEWQPGDPIQEVNPRQQFNPSNPILEQDPSSSPGGIGIFNSYLQGLSQQTANQFQPFNQQQFQPPLPRTLADLPTAKEWQPGDPIQEVNPRQTLNKATPPPPNPIVSGLPYDKLGPNPWDPRAPDDYPTPLLNKTMTRLASDPQTRGAPPPPNPNLGGLPYDKLGPNPWDTGAPDYYSGSPLNRQTGLAYDKLGLNPWDPRAPDDYSGPMELATTRMYY
jgi:hypothetical protein